MSSTVVFEQSSHMQRICGPNDRNLPYIELLLNGELFVQGNSMTFRERNSTEESHLELFSILMMRLKKLSEIQEEITEPEIFMEYQLIMKGGSSSSDSHVYMEIGNKKVFPKSGMQRSMMHLMREKQIVFSIGPSGTGKTFLAVAFALQEVLSGKKQKIILTRPVVESGENLGFLPGDVTQKIGPYIRPLYDAMEYLITPSIIRRLEEHGAIETAPLAYMRGRSLNNACVILDEGQNTTKEQMKMFLTRISENSVAIVTGDITQIDLSGRHTSGLIHAREILRGLDEIGIVEFSSSDVVRSKIVQRIVDAYEKDSTIA